MLEYSAGLLISPKAWSRAYDGNHKAQVPDAAASLTKKIVGFTLKETNGKNLIKMNVTSHL